MKWPSFLREPFVLDDDQAGRRMMPSPEGVMIELRLASHADRLLALIIDLLILNGVLILILLGFVSMLVIEVNPATVGTLYILLTFFVRVGYFLAFEMLWQGRTPGKRMMSVRVVDRQGRALTAMALASRNLMREVEVFMPLALLLSWQGNDQLSFLAALSWLGVLVSMPLLNRDRLRLGDMVAGTWVVRTDRKSLEEDLTAPQQAEEVREFRFSDAQLDVYGVSELQVLEKLLRREESPRKDSAVSEVCQRIREKIDWQDDGRSIDSSAFLRDYYAALRAHLERHALFGDRRVDKRTLAARFAKPAEAEHGTDGA